MLPVGGVCFHRQDRYPYSKQHGVHRVLHWWLPVQVSGRKLRAGRLLCHRWTCEQTTAESWQGECCSVPPSVGEITQATAYGHYTARCSGRPFTGHTCTAFLTCQHMHSTCSWIKVLLTWTPDNTSQASALQFMLTQFSSDKWWHFINRPSLTLLWTSP